MTRKPFGPNVEGEERPSDQLRRLVYDAMRLSSVVNAYVAEQEPWALVKSDRERAGTVLYVALRCVDGLKTLFTPFLPFTSQKVHE